MSVKDERPPINKTFCILPWRHLEVIPVGTAKICCVAEQPISENGKPMSLYEHTVDDIWNSEHLRNVRRAMLNGEPVKDCTYCYRAEALQGSSMRTDQNSEWLQEPEPPNQPEPAYYRVTLENGGFTSFSPLQHPSERKQVRVNNPSQRLTQ